MIEIAVSTGGIGVVISHLMYVVLTLRISRLFGYSPFEVNVFGVSVDQAAVGTFNAGSVHVVELSIGSLSYEFVESGSLDDGLDLEDITGGGLGRYG